MPNRVDGLPLVPPPPGRGERLWREWCFLRTAFRHFRVRFAVMFTILLGGGLLFKYLEPEKNHSLLEATYFTWCLVFGEPPEAFPRHVVLRALFFVVPILGLTVIIEGVVDLALMMGNRLRYERSWCNIMAASMSNHVILVGLGKLGYRTFCLLRHLGEQVVVIESDADKQFIEEVRRDGSPLLIGDGRRDVLLQEANIAGARSIILATNDDLANLEIALDARKLNPEVRVVLRMFDQNMADKIREGFDIHIAMSQSAMSAPAFATAAIDRSIVGSFMVGRQLVVMKRWHVQAHGPLQGKTVADLMVQHGIGVAERRPADGEPAVFPAPNTLLAPGDTLLVQGAFETIKALKSAS